MTAIDLIRQLVWNVSSEILKHTIVIYTSTENKISMHCNGVLFQNKTKTYILSAEHAFINKEAGDLLLFQNGSFCILEGELVGNPMYDIAILELSQSIASCLKEKYLPLKREQLLVNHKPEHKLKYLLVGYPSSKINIKGVNIKEKPIIYHTAATIKQTDQDDISFGYNKRKSGSFNQKGYIFAPNPQGLSGSGFWYISANSPDNFKYYLVGIFKEFIRTTNLAISTKLDCLIEGFKLYNP